MALHQRNARLQDLHRKRTGRLLAQCQWHNHTTTTKHTTRVEVLHRLGLGRRQIRKTLVSVKFVSAILGPEMAAPILWTPGKNAFFLQENLCPIKFLVLGGGGYFGFGGGGECRFYFYGRADFSEQNNTHTHRNSIGYVCSLRKQTSFLRQQNSNCSYFVECRS